MKARYNKAVASEVSESAVRYSGNPIPPIKDMRKFQRPIFHSSTSAVQPLSANPIII